VEQAVLEGASLTASEARERGVIELLAADVDALLAAADGRQITLQGQTQTLALADVRLEQRQPDWRVRILAALTHPNVAYVLMLIGIYGLIFELASPGSFGPGIIGGICLLLALYAFQVLPVSYAGLFTVCLLPAALGQPVQNLCIYLRYDFGRFAPYLDRPCRRSPTPDVSSVPRTV
jgi:membrane-bound serine protease (ClpP class)